MNKKGCLVSFFFNIYSKFLYQLVANRVDPDQRPHSVVFDLGLHCLPMPLLWDTRHKWVKTHKTCHKL